MATIAKGLPAASEEEVREILEDHGIRVTDALAEDLTEYAQSVTDQMHSKLNRLTANL